MLAGLLLAAALDPTLEVIATCAVPGFGAGSVHVRRDERHLSAELTVQGDAMPWRFEWNNPADDPLLLLGALGAVCEAGELVIMDASDPCFVVAGKLPRSRDAGGLAPMQHVGYGRAACKQHLMAQLEAEKVAARAKVEARAAALKALLAKDPACAAAGMSNTRDAALAKYKAKNPRAALQLLGKRAKACREALAADVGSLTWIYSDLLLYALRAKDLDRCDAAWFEAEHLGVAKGPEGTAKEAFYFNREACKIARFVVSKDVPEPGPLKTPPPPCASKASREHLVEGNDAFDGDKSQRHWVGKLTSRSARDVIRRLGREPCGSEGVCEFSVYVGCGGGDYVLAATIDSYSDLHVRTDTTKLGGVSWHVLEQYTEGVQRREGWTPTMEYRDQVNGYVERK